MDPPCLLSEKEHDPEPQKSLKETQQTDDEDAELVFVGVEHVNEDSELIFVGVTSNSKPIISNILNRVTPGSCSRRKKSGRLRKNCTYRSQPTSRMVPKAGTASLSESRSTDSPVLIEPLSSADKNDPTLASPSESRSTDSPIIIEHLCNPEDKSNSPQESLSESRSTDSPIILEPLSKSDYGNNSQVVPISTSELHSPLVTFTNSWHQPVIATLFVKDVNESLCVTKQHSTSDVSSINPQMLECSDGHIGGYSSASSQSGTFHTVNPHQIPPSNGIPASVNQVQTGVLFPTAFPKDNVYCKPLLDNELAKTDFSNLASPDKTFDPNKGNLIVLLRDFYYGEHKGDWQPKPKTYTTFKCLSCLKVLKNVKFMNHVKRHLEFEKQRSDSWENPTTCPHCHRQFPTPFQLERHIDNVHTMQELPTVCRICELSFETDQVLLEHMKDNHKPGELPYVCQVCNYRSSIFADVETHFRKCHANTKNLLCPFCLKVFKAATPYMGHYRGHWERSIHQCSKCRLQFLTFKEKMEHKTRYHQMFKKPKQLEGLPPETKVVIQVSLGPVQPGSDKVASITVNTTDSEPSSPSPKS